MSKTSTERYTPYCPPREEAVVKLTVRVTPSQREEISRRAEASHKSINQYLVGAGLSATSVPQNDQLRCMIMQALCMLENQIRYTHDWKSLYHEVSCWSQDLLQRLESDS